MYKPFEIEKRINNFRYISIAERKKLFLRLPIDEVDSIEYSIASEGFESLSEYCGISYSDRKLFHKAVKFFMYWSYWEQLGTRELLVWLSDDEAIFQ